MQVKENQWIANCCMVDWLDKDLWKLVREKGWDTEVHPRAPVDGTMMPTLLHSQPAHLPESSLHLTHSTHSLSHLPLPEEIHGLRLTILAHGDCAPRS